MAGLVLNPGALYAVGGRPLVHAVLALRPWEAAAQRAAHSKEPNLHTTVLWLVASWLALNLGILVGGWVWLAWRDARRRR